MQWVEVDADAWYPVARYKAFADELEFRISLYPRPELVGNYHLQRLSVVGDQCYWLGSAWTYTLAEAVDLAEEWLAGRGGSGVTGLNPA